MTLEEFHALMKLMESRFYGTVHGHGQFDESPLYIDPDGKGFYALWEGKIIFYSTESSPFLWLDFETGEALDK